MTDSRKCWMTYYADWSGMAVFHSEIKALRHAVEHRMEIMEVPEGVDLRELANKT